jgi:hypothetical protein
MYRRPLEKYIQSSQEPVSFSTGLSHPPPRPSTSNCQVQSSTSHLVPDGHGPMPARPATLSAAACVASRPGCCQTNHLPTGAAIKSDPVRELAVQQSDAALCGFLAALRGMGSQVPHLALTSISSSPHIMWRLPLGPASWASFLVRAGDATCFSLGAGLVGGISTSCSVLVPSHIFFFFSLPLFLSIVDCLPSTFGNLCFLTHTPSLLVAGASLSYDSHVLSSLLIAIRSLLRLDLSRWSHSRICSFGFQVCCPSSWLVFSMVPRLHLLLV